MEEIARNIEKLIETLNENSIPNWITIVGLLGPIFISILVWWLSNRQNKIHTQLEQQINDNNDKLQIAISDQQIKAQMHGDFLKTYDDFCYAQSTINGAMNQVHIIFSNFTCYNAPNMPTQWSNSINTATNVITQALNRAKLLLPKSDQELRSRLGLCDTGALLPEVQKANALPEDLPLFTMQGGMDKTKLRGFNKLMINMLTKGLASQKERTETDERMLYLLTHGENLVSEKNTAAFMEWYHLNKN